MSSPFPHAVEISLAVSAGHWLTLGASAGLGLLAIPALNPVWRLSAAALWAALVTGAAARLLAKPWERAIWQRSGAFRLENRERYCVAQLGPHSYLSRHLIVLHLTDGAKSWYFFISRGAQPDAFRRCAARLRQAGRQTRIR